MFDRKLVAAGVAGALGLIVAAAPVHAGPVTNRALEIVGAGAAADPLIAVEANRSAIVDRIVADHADVIATMGNGAEAALRTALAGLRADQLLAASLVGSLAEITAIISGQSSDGAALQRFVALAPAAPSSALPSAQAYLVSNADTLTIVAAADLAASGGQVVGYFTPTVVGTMVTAAAAPIAPKDGSGTGAGSWIGYTAGGNVASGSGSAVGAGKFNAATNTNASIFAGQSNEASGVSSLVIGGFDNHAQAIDALVGAGAGNRVTGARSIVVGGGYNLASGQFSFIGGGGRDGAGSTIAGSDPKDNIASANFSVVTGGQGNLASGLFAAVPGGTGNVASGSMSFAAGNRAKTQTAGGSPTIHDGAFVFADGSAFDFNTAASNEFAVRATGGARFVTAIDGAGAPTKTMTLDPSGNLTVPGNVAASGVVSGPARIIWVAKARGNFTSVQAAVTAAAAIATATTPVLVRIAPGIYNEQVTLADYVDIEGSGQNMTTITYAGTGGTIVAGANSEVSNLTVVNTFAAASPGANAVYQTASSVAGISRFSNASLIADGATDNFAVYVTGGTLGLGGVDVEAAPSATQTSTEVGLYASGASTKVTVKNSKLAASGTGGATKYSAQQAASASIRIENTQLGGLTNGAPLCFQVFSGATWTAQTCI